MPSVPILWHFPISHFDEKVRWALDFKRIPHVLPESLAELRNSASTHDAFGWVAEMYRRHRGTTAEVAW